MFILPLDINECTSSDSHNCSGLEVCMNQLGSFQCNCLAGYTRSTSGMCEGEIPKREGGKEGSS